MGGGGDYIAGRLMSLLWFLRNPWLPIPQSSAEKADNDEVATLLEKERKKEKRGITLTHSVLCNGMLYYYFE